MDLVVFEEDRTFVLEAFQDGRFDYVDITTQIAETRFFKFLLDKRLLHHLGATYPTPRKKVEVPTWAAVVSNLSLRYHGSQSFHSFPYIVRLGGLLDALDPAIAARKVDPQQRTVELRCPGFNQKNHYPRKTPWDQDFLRKFAKRTDPERLVAWFNKEIVWCVKETIGFGPEGLFIGDATYLFVPDNDQYEGSTKLLFDEHNHPVEAKTVDPAKLKAGTYRWRRCYQAVLLLHLNRRQDFFIVAGLTVLNGKANPLHPLYHLVREFVAHAGPGVMKHLIVDRGFLDGAEIGACKQDLGIDVTIGVKTSMDLYDEAQRLTAHVNQWQPYRPPPAPPSLGRVLPPALARREATRQATVRARKVQEPPQITLVAAEVAGVQDVTAWANCPVPLHAVVTRETWSDGTHKTFVLTTTKRFADPCEVRWDYALRPAIEERHRQLKCFWDLTKFRSRAFSLVVNQVVSVLLTYSLLQMRVCTEFRGALNDLTLPQLRRHLEPRADRVVIDYQQRFVFLTLHEYSERLLTLPDAARVKILARTRQLKRQLEDFLPSPRPP